MRSNNSNGSRAASARGFAALFAIMAAMGLSLAAFPAEAATFAYVTSAGSVSVIDTATNMVTAFVNTGARTTGVAITPDGKCVYVTVPSPPPVVDVYTTATNTVVAGIPIEPVMDLGFPVAIAVTPDGKHAYVTSEFTNHVLVIDTATNTVVGSPITVGNEPVLVAVTPDGKHVYVVKNGLPTNFLGTVSVIDTATNTVEAGTITVGNAPAGVAVAPDGTHVYVANGGTFPNFLDGSVSVITTASNAVGTTIPVPGGAGGGSPSPRTGNTPMS